LIVVDEAHDSSYKQDKTPFYQTLRVAGALSSSTGARLIMGSATPSVSEYFLARRRQVPILTMTKPAIKTPVRTETTIVDMTSRDNLGKFPLLSKPLVEELAKALADNCQAMVFINKRGDSKSIICQNCGWQAKCASCDLPLTFHSDNSQFSCHTCGRQYPSRTTCATPPTSYSKARGQKP
jgi:primosomal protein N' (replication factor Y)